MRVARLLFVCLGLVIGGCSAGGGTGTGSSGSGGGGGGEPGPDGGTGSSSERLTCDTGASHFYLVNMIDVGKSDASGSVPGVNLDGRVSDGSDPNGCRHPDFTSPPPDSESGVDNQLGVLAAELESQMDLSESLRNAIAEGKLTVVAELSNVDDLADDDCVHLEVGLGYPAEGLEAPELGADGRPVSGATYDVRPLARVQGRIVDGRVFTDPADIHSELTLAEPPVPVTIADAEVRFDVTADRLSNGVIAGSMRVATLQEMVEAMSPENADLAALVLRSHADLEPGADGCQALSAGFVFEGVDAVRGAERE